MQTLEVSTNIIKAVQKYGEKKNFREVLNNTFHVYKKHIAFTNTYSMLVFEKGEGDIEDVTINVESLKGLLTPEVTKLTKKVHIEKEDSKTTATNKLGATVVGVEVDEQYPDVRSLKTKAKLIGTFGVDELMKVLTTLKAVGTSQFSLYGQEDNKNAFLLRQNLGDTNGLVAALLMPIRSDEAPEEITLQVE